MFRNDSYDSLNANIRFGVSESKEMYDYMGSSLSGLGYKFPYNEVC